MDKIIKKDLNDFTVKNNDGKIKEAKEKDVPDEIKKIIR